MRLPGLVAPRVGVRLHQGDPRQRQRAGVTCAGQWIEPGDVVVADDDGVVIVPRDRTAADVLAAARRARRSARPASASALPQRGARPGRERHAAETRGQGTRLRRAASRSVDHRHPRPLHDRTGGQLKRFRQAQLARLLDSGFGRAAAGEHQRRRAARERRDQPAAGAARARRRPDDLLAAGVGHGAPRARPGDRGGLGASEQRPRRTASPTSTPRTSRRSASCPRPRAGPRTTSSPSCAGASRSSGSSACNLNPDPSGGFWNSPPLTDPYWFPVYEALVELDVPAMVHVSTSCNPVFHALGAHYLNADTSAFMQLLEGDLFARFPTLRLVIPHGGGAVPYHWGRYRGLADRMGWPDPAEPAAQRLLRHLRLPPAGHRPADPRDPDGEHPLRVGDARRRPRHDPETGHRVGRHQALPGRRAAERQAAGRRLRGQRPPGLPAAGRPPGRARPVAR